MRSAPLGRTTLRLAVPALDDVADRFRPADVDEVRPLDPYALDPFRLADEGHVKIFDLETQTEDTLILWPNQREAIADWIDLEALQRGELICRNVVEEKSRQMGMTWALLYASMWMVGWWPHAGMMLKTKEKDVDDGGMGSSPESLFGRIRYMHSRLPVYVRPPLSFKHLLITNDRLAGARIVGSASGPDPGRGGRYKWALIDEAARTPYDESVHSAVRLACPVGRFYNSTPRGTNNVYYRLRRDKPKGYIIRTDHWSDHPVYGEGAHIAGELPETCPQCAGTVAERTWTPSDPVAHRYPGKLTSPWYENEILDMTDEEVATELDIDYHASVRGKVYKQFDRRVHVIEQRLYDPAQPVELAIDYGVSDPTSVIVLQDFPDSLRAVGEYEAAGQTPQDVYDGLIEVLADLGVQLVSLQPSFTRHLFAVGDRAGEGLQLPTGRSLVADYAEAGLTISSSSRVLVKPSIIRVQTMLSRGVPKPLRISGTDCPGLVEHFSDWAWPVDAQGRPKPHPTKPNHDEHSHAMDAFRYYVEYKFGQATGGTGDSLVEEDDGRIDPGITYDMKL